MLFSICDDHGSDGYGGHGYGYSRSDDDSLGPPFQDDIEIFKTSAPNRRDGGYGGGCKSVPKQKCAKVPHKIPRQVLLTMDQYTIG